MDGNRFTLNYFIPGTMTANVIINVALPCGATLAEVSAVQSNAGNARLQVGTATDSDAIMASQEMGTAGTPKVFDRGDFDGVLAAGQGYAHLAKGDLLMLTVDYDGAAGVAGQNVSILLTMLEG